ncbi:MAG: DNA repair protein RadA, partial [Prochlorococcus sp.]
MRNASVYVCQSCGAQTRQFFGRCASCGNWNPLIEQVTRSADGRRSRSAIDPLAE